MSRARNRFEKALAKKGHTIKECYWEPIGGNVEMCGPSGGWYVTTNEAPGDPILGYNQDAVIKYIERFVSNLSIDAGSDADAEDGETE